MRLFVCAAAFCAAALIGVAPPNSARAETLLQIYEAALENDPTLKAAEANVELGESRFFNAFLRYFPRAYAQLDFSRTRQRILESENTIFDLGTARYNTFDGLVNVTQPIIDFERIYNVRSERTARDRAAAEFAASRQRLVIRVVQRYLEALAARKRVELLSAAVDAARAETRRAAVAAQDALATESELRSVEAQALLAEGELVAARTAYQNALEAIGEITGATPTALARVAQEVLVVQPDPADPEAWVDRALQGNADLRVQNLTVIAAERERDELFAKHLPRVELIGTYDYLDREGSQFGGGSQGDDAVLMLRVRIPIFNADGEGYEHRQAAVQQRIEQHNLDRDRRLVTREVRNFHRLTAAAPQRVNALTRALAARKSALLDTRALQEAGLATSVDVLEAQRDMLRSERDLFDAQMRYLLDYFSLLSLTGGVAEHHIVLVDGYLEQR